jgi:nucleotide-binding universal stress UspA family protein
MFQKILLPVDLSNRHAQALQAAAALARPGAEVVLLHVIEIIPGLSLEEEKDFYQRLEKAARRHLAQLGKQLEQGGVTWRAETIYGQRGPDILRYAGETGTDLILLTSPRPDPAHPAAGWGSLSHKVGLLSSCPVLLVK